MSLLLPEIAMRGTESQDRVVTTPRSQRTFLRRYGVIAGIAAALLFLVVWSARAWLSSEKVISRERIRTAVVERGPFVRDVAATGTVVAAVSPTLFAEAPGTIIYKVRAGDTVKAGDVLGTVDSAALTNEYEQERATLAGTDASLNRQTIEVRRAILKSGQDTDLAKVQITAAEREFKRAAGCLEHPRDTGARLRARPRRSRNRQAELRARHGDRRPREGQPATRAAQPARAA